MEKLCTKCNKEPRRANTKQRWCKTCHNSFMREWRKTHTETEEQRIKGNARSYLRVYIRRGKIARGICEVCGDLKTVGHHDDYTKPLQVKWLCRKHHLEVHKTVL